MSGNRLIIQSQLPLVVLVEPRLRIRFRRIRNLFCFDYFRLVWFIEEELHSVTQQIVMLYCQLVFCNKCVQFYIDCTHLFSPHTYTFKMCLGCRINNETMFGVCFLIFFLLFVGLETLKVKLIVCCTTRRNWNIANRWASSFNSEKMFLLIVT